MTDTNSRWLIPVLLALGAAAALGYFWFETSRDVAPENVAAPVPAAAEPEVLPDSGEPRYPVSPAMPERVGAVDLTPLPALDDSDRYFELAMVDVFGTGIDDMLVDAALIEKIVATVDNLSRPLVAERTRPIAGVDDPFTADGQDGSGLFTLNPSNYRRYDFLVNLLATADIDALVDTYRRFYPLFQEAYVNLGYPNGYFNDRAVEVIDHLLETPDIDEPVELVRPHVLYEYADPALEERSSGQKLLLRIGAEHRVRVLQFLEELREAIIVLETPPR